MTRSELCAGLALASLLALPAWSQSSAGEEISHGARSIGRGAESIGKGTAKGVSRGTGKAVHATKREYNKIR